jgi:hypothetical protein
MERKKNRTSNVVPIDRVEEARRWVPAPVAGTTVVRGRMREFSRSRGNMFFSAGIPKRLVDFSYRSTRRLKLTRETIFITRGAVRRDRDRIMLGASVRRLDWGVGHLITIPRGIRHNDIMELHVGYEVHSFRTIELLTLGALMRLAWPRRSQAYLTSMAAQVIARGWITDGTEPVCPAGAGRRVQKR